ncbi:ATP-binding protein [Persephonella sp.]
MKPFHTVAVPHRDILEGKLELNIFAANLWKVYKGEAPSEYQDKEEFFRKTFLTKGLQNLLDIVKKRLEGKGGDPVIQLQTPFGGGKTHTLIAMYHKAKEWEAKTVVIEGTALSGDTKLWELLEKQLTGKVEILKGDTAPGRDKIEKVLKENQPVLVLIDELLEYITKAAGIKIVETTLASQTIAFLQELTEAASILDKTALIITLPSSVVEHYDEKAEFLFQQLQKVSGRVERIYTPVEEEEITQVIRKRLFSTLNQNEMKKIVNHVVDYFQKENIIPSGIEPSEYRKLFENSYPFSPEVVEILYERWGSFPTFQRTRGVLRLLSLVIYDNKDKHTPYISLADFDLSNQEIRRELLKHIETQYDSVIASDITSENAGAKKVDQKLGDAYKGLKLGTRTATTIFMYSFSGGVEKGATKNEIKRNATTLNNPSSVIGEALEELKNNLYYLQYENGKYFFTNQPNLNRIIITKMENISDEKVEEFEKEILKKFISPTLQDIQQKTYTWIENSQDIPDTPEFKLVILKKLDKNLMEKLITTKGNSPRVNRNNIFFLAPVDAYKNQLFMSLRKLIAYEEILNDETLNLNENQIKEVKTNLEKLKSEMRDTIRHYYRIVFIPAKEGFKEEDLGTPIYGDSKKLNEEVFDFLISKQEILKSIAPIVIEGKYLSSKDFVKISDIYQSSLKTRGETRFKNIDVLLNAVKEGVKSGVFGLGIETNKGIECKTFKEELFSVDENAFIVKKELCKKLEEKKIKEPTETETTQISQPVSGYNTGETKTEEPQTVVVENNIKETVELNFKLPKGKALEIGRLLNLLDMYFEDIEVVINAKNGKLSKEEYEMKILETLKQLNIEP